MNLEKSAILNLRKWKEDRMAEIKARQEELVAQLRAVVPECFRAWLRDEGESVINNLIKFGNDSRKYCPNSDQGFSCGYIDLREFMMRFEKLKIAWMGVVDIKCNLKDHYYLEVFCTAV